MIKKPAIFSKVLSLFLSAALLTAGLPLSAAAETTSGKDDFVLATAADMHYFPASLAGSKGADLYTYLSGSNCVYDDLDAMLDASMDALAKEKAQHIVLVGDLTTNGEYEGHRALAAKYEEFERKTGKKVYVINGNHDVNMPDASQFVNGYKEKAVMTSPADFAEIYKNLGYGEDVYHQYKSFTGNTHGCLTYSVRLEKEGYRLILADGGKYTGDITASGKSEAETGGVFTEELTEWIKAEAADAIKAGETPLLFTHWNMSDANYMHEKVLQGFVIDDGYMLQEELADAGIHYAFSGHQHISDLDITYSDSGEPMYSVITPSLTQFPFSYRTTTFSDKGAEGLKVTFDQKYIDEYSPVRTPDGTGFYNSPYAVNYGFGKLYGNGNGTPDTAGYVMNLVRKGLGDILTDIKKSGNIISYIEDTKGISIEAEIDDLIYGGIEVDGESILTGENAMGFLRDIDKQIMDKYIRNTENPNIIFEIIDEALRNISAVQLPGVTSPCSKFVDSYGFGDKTKPGTFGDVVLSVMAYFYAGNEDISDDLFMQEFLEFCKTPEFTDFIINTLRKYIVEDVLVDEVLSGINFHVDSFFVEGTAPFEIAQYIRLFVELCVLFLGAGILDIRDMDSFVAFVKNVTESGNKEVSFKDFIKAMLGSKLIPLGNNFDELIDSLVNKFITDDVRTGLSAQAYEVIGGMVTDDSKDFGVTHTYKGKAPVAPTKEDRQLPVNINIAPAKDASTGFTVSWLTKYSVEGSNIEFLKNGSYTARPSLDAVIKTTSEEAEYSYNGFDAGTFGILPRTEKVIKHTATVTGLEPDTEYLFRIGDSGKNFWSSCSVKTAPEKGGSFTLISIADTEGVVPSQYDNLSLTLSAAKTMYPEASHIIHSGNLVTQGFNDRQWSWALDGAEKFFSSMSFAYAPGLNDSGNTDKAYKNLAVSSLSQVKDTALYYSYNYGDAHITVIDTNDISKTGKIKPEQLKWIKDDLSESTALWNILVMNKGIYSVSPEKAVKEQLLKIMEEQRVDLILQGNDKVYARTEILKNDSIAEKGTAAVTGGASGCHFGEVLPSGEIFAETFTSDSPVFTAISVDNHILEVTAYTVDESGKASETDSFTLEKEREKLLLGDADLKGEITSADARLALRSAVKLERLTPKLTLAMDVNKSGAVEAADARLILRKAARLESYPTEYVYYIIP